MKMRLPAATPLSAAAPNPSTTGAAFHQKWAGNVTNAPAEHYFPETNGLRTSERRLRIGLLCTLGGAPALPGKQRCLPSAQRFPGRKREKPFPSSPFLPCRFPDKGQILSSQTQAAGSLQLITPGRNREKRQKSQSRSASSPAGFSLVLHAGSHCTSRRR